MIRTFLKHVIVIVTGLLSLLYLLNPPFCEAINLTFDWMPLVGKLDETLAVTLLLNALAFYGIDLTRYFGRSSPHRRDASGAAAPAPGLPPRDDERGETQARRGPRGPE